MPMWKLLFNTFLTFPEILSVHVFWNLSTSLFRCWVLLLLFSQIIISTVVLLRNLINMILARDSRFYLLRWVGQPKTNHQHNQAPPRPSCPPHQCHRRQKFIFQVLVARRRALAGGWQTTRSPGMLSSDPPPPTSPPTHSTPTSWGEGGDSLWFLERSKLEAAVTLCKR